MCLTAGKAHVLIYCLPSDMFEMSAEHVREASSSRGQREKTLAGMGDYSFLLNEINREKF